MRAHPRFFRRHVKARRTVHAIAIEQGHGRNAQVRASGNQILGYGCALQKTEGRPRM